MEAQLAAASLAGATVAGAKAEAAQGPDQSAVPAATGVEALAPAGRSAAREDIVAEGRVAAEAPVPAGQSGEQTVGAEARGRAVAMATLTKDMAMAAVQARALAGV